MNASDPPAELRVVVVGCTVLARKVVELVEELCDLVGVVNLHPDLGLEKANYDPLSALARRRPNDLYLTADINGRETVGWIADRRPDVLIQCGWSQIFGDEVLAVPRLLCIGIHPSPLPIGRGGAVINWKLIEGGGAWGNSLFVMEPSVDAGDVLDFEPFVIEPRDDVRTAYLKVDRTALSMLRRTLPRIRAGTYERRRQDDAAATRYPRRRPEDGRLDVSWQPARFLDMVRALTHPFPGAFLETAFGKLLVWTASRGADAGVLTPGTVVDVQPGRGVGLQVGAGGTVWLELVTPANDIERWADEWAADVGLSSGRVLVGVSSACAPLRVGDHGSSAGVRIDRRGGVATDCAARSAATSRAAGSRGDSP